MEEVMRRSVLLLMVAALSAAGCDRRSGQGEQGAGNVAATAQASPDEVAPAAGATPAGAAASPAGKIDRSQAGTAAPAFAFAGPDGKPTSLAALRGKPVLLNLWATWCGPCVKELPTLDALAARGGVRVVALSQDLDAAKPAAFLRQRKLPHLAVYTDPAMRWLPAVTSNLPTSILYGADGKERWRVLGDLDWTGPVATAALAEAR